MPRVLKHYGTKRHSGRYPWGSGGHSQQRGKSFLGMVEELRKEGLSNAEIAKGMGLKSTELTQIEAIEKNRIKAANISEAFRLKEKGLSNIAIGERMGRNESTIRSWLSTSEQEKENIIESTAAMLKRTVDTKGPIDVGSGVETDLNITRNKFKTAITAARMDGYQIMYLREKQLGTGEYTSIMVLAPPDADYREVFLNRKNLASINEVTVDSGRTWQGLKPVQHVDSDRIYIRYGDEGGADKDGVIELRPGVEDIDLGNSKYAQVRMGVDGTHYMKGMAYHTNDIPDGYDIVYNVNKKRSSVSNSKEVFKELKIDDTTGEVDADNPFGTKIKRDGQHGALNIVYEQGDWKEWSRNISSQILSKQSTTLAKKQLNLAKELKIEEYDEIMQLTNPVVRQHLLQKFADGCDSSAVHLKAASLPRQASHVILPITDIKPTEIYAPMLNDGERVAVLRHPHGGRFEIAEVTVNNKNKTGKHILGRHAQDAVGLHPEVAHKLSGADFDGDTVIVIPNAKGEIKSSPSLHALKNFDTKMAYPPYDGMKTVDGGIYNAETKKVSYPGNGKPKKGSKQLLMGDVSNLITDMTIKGATPAELARAVKHSMVVIDSEKHHLNNEQSYLDNNIAALKKKYQGRSDAGASTVISRASSQERVPHRKEGILVTDPKTGKLRRQKIDPKTGDKLYELTGEEYISKKTGKTIVKQTISTKMAEAKSAFELSSGTPMETIYAEYADNMKGLARTARLESLKIPPIKKDPQAAKVYSKEVASMDAKLREIARNRPKERKAQLLANHIYNAKLDAHPDLDKGEKKRLRGQVLIEARHRTGASKPTLTLSDREWTAIQMRAVSQSKAATIIRNTDLDFLRQKSMPRTAYKMTPAKVNRAKTMAASGYTPAEIASALGVSATTIVDTINS